MEREREGEKGKTFPCLGVYPHLDVPKVQFQHFSVYFNLLVDVYTPGCPADKSWACWLCRTLKAPLFGWCSGSLWWLRSCWAGGLVFDWSRISLPPTNSPMTPCPATLTHTSSNLTQSYQENTSTYKEYKYNFLNGPMWILWVSSL